MKKISRIQFFLGALLLSIAIFLIGAYARPKATNNLTVYFLNVGQGDASYIKTPNGADILIDGGPDSSVLNELGQVMNFNDREINLVILSHPHADHLTGLVEVLSRYKVDEIWETGVEYPSATYDAWKNKIAAEGIADKIVQANDTENFGDVKLTVLYPLSSLKNQSIDNLNNASIISRLQFQNFSVLFSGDAEHDAQEKVISKYPSKDLLSDILKVSHHGSQNGADENFLKIVRPASAVISVGKGNSFGHPASSTIALLKKYAVRIFRTDQDGRIEIDSDGKNYSVLKNP